MEKNLILIGILLICTIFIFGCTSNERIVGDDYITPDDIGNQQQTKNITISFYPEIQPVPLEEGEEHIPKMINLTFTVSDPITEEDIEQIFLEAYTYERDVVDECITASMDSIEQHGENRWILASCGAPSMVFWELNLEADLSGGNIQVHGI